MSRKAVVFVTVLVLLASAAIIVWSFSGAVLFPFQKPSQPPTEVPSKRTYTGLELAQKILALTDKAKLASGDYPKYLECEKVKGCMRGEEVFESPPAVLTFAFLHLYRATGDKKYLRIADEAVEKSFSVCANSTASHCFHYPLLLTLLPHYTNDQKYLQLAPKLRAAMDNIATKTSADTSGIEPFMVAGHLLDYFAATKEEKYKVAALKSYELAKKDTTSPMLYTIGGYTVRKNSCQDLLNTVDFYRILQEKKYLDEASDQIEKAQFHQNASSFPQSFFLAGCMEAYLNLFELTGETRYHEGAVAMMRTVVKDFMDHPQNSFYTADYGIVNRKEPTKGYKWLEHNFWIMSSLARMKDVSFQI